VNVGLDIGYSAVKMIAGDRWATFPSVVGTPDRGRFGLNGHSSDELVLVEPAHVAVGEGAVLQSRFLTRREDRGWIRSEAYYHLFLAALSEATRATAVDLILVTGLPVAFYSDRVELQERLAGAHQVAREKRRGQRFNVATCRVIPQPFGALLAEALDDRGKVRDQALATRRAGVVDVGGKTTNLLSVDRLNEVGRETASIPLGAWDVARAVTGYLAEHCPGLELRDHQVQEAIRERRVTYYDQEIDLGPAVDEVLAHLADQVVSEAGHLWNGGANLAAILVAGGGAHLVGPAVRRAFRHARVVADPVYANALGYWKLAQRLGSNTQSE
jgi:plasmid segregation protein ParM